MRQVLATQFGGPEVLATSTTSDPVRGTRTGRRRRRGGRHSVRGHTDPPRLGARALHGETAVRARWRRGRSR